MRNTLWIILIYCFNPLYAQENDIQKWVDYTLEYPIATHYTLKYNGAYKTTGWKGDWRAIENSLSVERNIGDKITINFLALIAFNKQTEDYSTLELRPSLGLRYYFRPIRRYYLSFYTQYESRHVENLEDDSWTQTHRLRLRPELKIPFNRKILNDNKLWYAISEVEWFANLGEQEEFFANRFRISAGIGYRHNDAWRFELVYVWQLSKNTIDDEFNGSSNILRFRVKNYLPSTSKNRN